MRGRAGPALAAAAALFALLSCMLSTGLLMLVLLALTSRGRLRKTAPLPGTPRLLCAFTPHGVKRVRTPVRACVRACARAHACTRTRFHMRSRGRGCMAMSMRVCIHVHGGVWWLGECAHNVGWRQPGAACRDETWDNAKATPRPAEDRSLGWDSQIIPQRPQFHSRPPSCRIDGAPVPGSDPQTGTQRRAVATRTVTSLDPLASAS